MNGPLIKTGFIITFTIERFCPGWLFGNFISSDNIGAIESSTTYFQRAPEKYWDLIGLRRHFYGQLVIVVSTNTAILRIHKVNNQFFVFFSNFLISILLTASNFVLIGQKWKKNVKIWIRIFRIMRASYMSNKTRASSLSCSPRIFTKNEFWNFIVLLNQ